MQWFNEFNKSVEEKIAINILTAGRTVAKFETEADRTQAIKWLSLAIEYFADAKILDTSPRRQTYRELLFCNLRIASRNPDFPLMFVPVIPAGMMPPRENEDVTYLIREYTVTCRPTQNEIAVAKLIAVIQSQYGEDLRSLKIIQDRDRAIPDQDVHINI